MIEDQKDKQEKFQGCCEGMPFAEMMRKMMADKKPGSFNCAEMMSRMKDKCCGAAKDEKDRA
jgi:hypothetical protein